MSPDRTKILLVEDDHHHISLIKRAFEYHGANYKLVTAKNLREAKRQLSIYTPNFLIVDMQLPDGSGAELLDNKPTSEQVPIIFLTSHGDEHTAVKAIKEGAMDYLVKSDATFKQLPNIVRRTLREWNQVVERKRAEHELKKSKAELEKKVKERTAVLEETNAALKVILDQREKDKTEMEDKIVSNVKELVLPYVEKLEASPLKPKQKDLIEIIKANLNNILEPFLNKLSSQFFNLTPMEIKVANLVKEGKTNKEIADMLGVSTGTILTHRHNLRDKLGLTNQKVNLRSYLMTLK